MAPTTAKEPLVVPVMMGGAIDELEEEVVVVVVVIGIVAVFVVVDVVDVGSLQPLAKISQNM